MYASSFINNEHIVQLRLSQLGRTENIALANWQGILRGPDVIFTECIHVTC